MSINLFKIFTPAIVDDIVNYRAGDPRFLFHMYNIDVKTRYAVVDSIKIKYKQLYRVITLPSELYIDVSDLDNIIIRKVSPPRFYRSTGLSNNIISNNIESIEKYIELINNQLGLPLILLSSEGRSRSSLLEKVNSMSYRTLFDISILKSNGKHYESKNDVPYFTQRYKVGNGSLPIISNNDTAIQIALEILSIESGQDYFDIAGVERDSQYLDYNPLQN